MREQNWADPEKSSPSWMASPKVLKFVGSGTTLWTIHGFLGSYKTINTLRNNLEHHKNSEQEQGVLGCGLNWPLVDVYLLQNGINYSKCFIPPCNPHLLSGKWDTFHQALLGHWTKPSPHWPICSWCIWCCMVKMHYRSTVLVWLLQPVRCVCNGLLKFCVAMNRHWLMSVLVQPFSFCFFFIPPSFHLFILYLS